MLGLKSLGLLLSHKMLHRLIGEKNPKTLHPFFTWTQDLLALIPTHFTAKPVETQFRVILSLISFFVENWLYWRLCQKRNYFKTMNWDENWFNENFEINKALFHIKFIWVCSVSYIIIIIFFNNEIIKIGIKNCFRKCSLLLEYNYRLVFNERLHYSLAPRYSNVVSGN